MTRLVTGGLIASGVVAVFAVLLFFQYRDPMLLAFAVQALVPIWVVVLVIHVLRNGIPVRIVEDERRRLPDEERPQP